MPRRTANLVTMVAVPLGAIVALRHLGGVLAGPSSWSPDGLGRWASERDPVTVAMAVFRLAALGLAYQLLAVTALAVIGSLGHLPVLARAADLLALPGTRGLMRRAVGATISASTLLPSLAGNAAPSPPSVVVLSVDPVDPNPAPPATPVEPEGTGPSASGVPSREAVPGVGTDEDPGGGAATMTVIDASPPRQGLPAPVEPGAPTPSTTPPRSPTPPEPSAPIASAVPTSHPAGLAVETDRWVVRRGDHLWSISERVLARTWGRPPSEKETDEYWRSVILANASVSDPDIVVPGQAIELPPVPAP